MIVKLYLTLLNLLYLSSACKCYSSNNTEKYTQDNIICNSREFKNWQVLRVLPGIYFACNTTCPTIECVDGKGLELLMLTIPPMTYYTTFGACYDIKDYDYFCKR